MDYQLVGFMGRRVGVYGCLFFTEGQHSLGVQIPARMDMAAAIFD